MLIEALTTVLVTGGVSAFLAYKAGKQRARNRDLAIANAALERHYHFTSIVVSDPGLPLSLKEMVLALSQSVCDRKTAESLARALQHMNVDSQNVDHPDHTFNGTVVQLKAARPDLAKQLMSAIGSGIIALMYQWPDTAAVMDRFIDGSIDAAKPETVVERADTTVFRSGAAYAAKMLREPSGFSKSKDGLFAHASVC
jgi:hypothetical protein